jgi:4-cresol dehydrogenase (hydroxylating) flavoprotein subunit
VLSSEIKLMALAGIVTKMGIWLQSQLDMTCSVSVGKEDLVPQAAILSDLQRHNIIQNSPSIANLFRQAITSVMDPEVMKMLGPLLGTKGAIPEAALQGIATARGWGYWQAHFALYGPKTIVQNSWDFVKTSFAKVPGAKCEGKLFTGVDSQPIQTADLPVEAHSSFGYSPSQQPGADGLPSKRQQPHLVFLHHPAIRKRAL